MKLDTKEMYKDYFSPAPASPITVPKQIRRTLPACLALILLLVLLSTSFGGAGSKYFDSRPTIFPRKIWQTWKVDPLGMEEKDSAVAKTWLAKNPDYRYEVLTDQNDLAYVETNFGPSGLNRLDIVYMYRELTARIIKADLLRYLVMYIEGGIYTDIDVEALRPIKSFIPERWNERDVDMIVGIEVDQPEFHNHSVLGSKCMSFCQWTFMCKPRQQVMLTLVENIIAWLKSVATEQKVPIGEIQLDFDQVISGTGPSAFTRAILADISRKAGRSVKWEEFHAMAESKLVGGLLVLNVEAFAAGQGHSDSGNHDTKHALVKHHYHASGWPTAHPRFNHPMYGEVEKCNWVPECVQKWDEDTAAWESLAPEEQKKQIAMKEAMMPPPAPEGAMPPPADMLAPPPPMPPPAPGLPPPPPPPF